MGVAVVKSKLDGRAARRERSHAKIVDEAARLLRERGADGLSVDDLMRAAGLTRGGFYAHFRDKRALVATALDHAFAQQRARLFGNDDACGPELLSRVLHRYLSREHLEEPGLGCPAPALATEVRRAAPIIRAVFTRNMARVVEIFIERGGLPKEQALVVCALAVGAVTIGRAVDDPRFADAILSAARHHLAALPGAGPKKQRAPRPRGRTKRRSP